MRDLYLPCSSVECHPCRYSGNHEPQVGEANKTRVWSKAKVEGGKWKVESGKWKVEGDASGSKEE